MSTHRKWKSVLALSATALLLALYSGAAHAQPVAFDLEDQTPTPGSKDQGRLSSLTLVKEGVAIRITRPGSLFDLCDNFGLGPDWQKDANWRAISLSTFFDASSATPLVIDFSVPIAAFSLDIGDFSQDTDALEVEAFSEAGGRGTSVACTVETLPDNNSYDKFTFKRLEVRGDNIRSVRVLCGSASEPHSMYYDNLAIEQTSPPSG